MKQDITTYLIDSFVDFEGKEHKIVACALSQSPEPEPGDRMMVGWVNSENELLTSELICDEVYRLVTVGIAICNPEDDFDEEKGKRLAYNKAANIETLPRIYTANKGVITSELVDTFLKQQVRFFKENPETLIRGYKEAEEAYNTTEQAKKDIENLTNEEKVVFDLAVKGFDFSKYVKLAKVYVKKILKNE